MRRGTKSELTVINYTGKGVSSDLARPLFVVGGYPKGAAPHEGIVPSDIWLTCRKKLMNLTGANNVLLSYVNVKIAELDGRKQELLN